MIRVLGKWRVFVCFFFLFLSLLKYIYWERGEKMGKGVKMEGGKGKEVVVVMDTPDRSGTQIAAPIPKFEVCCVFLGLIFGVF